MGGSQGCYHCKHHQTVIPPEGADEPEPDKTSQAD